MGGISDSEIGKIEVFIGNGGSNRQAARDILGKESRESSIRSMIKSGKIVPKGDINIFKGPKILTIDIETAPVEANVWALFKQNIGLNMIKTDWYVLSYCAKWSHKDEIIYSDKRDSHNNEDDIDLIKEVWELLNEADIVIGQNSVRFDTKKLFARMVIRGMKPPSRFRQVDTMLMAKRHFGFTSNKLEYLTDTLCTKYKKSTHGKFSGFELWKECLAGNIEAWEEMEHYNINDVLSTEELYRRLAPWSNNHPNINLYHEGETELCHCGNSEWEKNGYAYTNLSKFDKFRCTSCGNEQRGRVNLLGKSKRQSLMANIV